MESLASGAPLLVPGDGTVRRSSNSSQLSLCPPWCDTDQLTTDGEDNPGDVELVSNPNFSEGETAFPETIEVESRPLEMRPTGSRSLSRRYSWAGKSNSARLATYYLVYCVVCLLLTGILLVVAIVECFAPRKEARFWRRELRPWEEATEAFVGAALCTETFAVFIALGPRIVLRDKWRFLDAAIAGLTLLCGLFFVFRRVLRGAQRVVEDMDVPILALRFALQPMRMVSTAAMVVRAQRRRRKRKPAAVEQDIIDPRQFQGAAASLCSALTPRLASELRELLPCYLRYVDWHLGYAPKVHGTSLRTFYRRQAGPNLLVVRDANGGLFGGFAPEAWRPTSAAYGTGESFVFVVREQGAALADDGATAENANVNAKAENVAVSGNADMECAAPLTNCSSQEQQSIEVFRATLQQGEVIQWSDSKMLGLGHAVVVCEDFLRGTSQRCEAFGCQSPLSAADDFIIKEFECWHVGTPHRGYIPDD